MNTPRTYAKSPELEAAVVADPENDLPRLVYADWLDEHDDPHRAAFIRAQCALWDKNPADEDRCDLLEAHREVVHRLGYRKDLVPDVPRDAGSFHDDHYNDDIGNDIYKNFHRGFPYTLQEPEDKDNILPSQFIAALPELYRRSTCRGFLWRGRLSPLANQLLNSEHAKGISFLALDHSPLTWQAIRQSPAAGTLRWIHCDLFDDDEATELADAIFPHLMRLEFHGFRCSEAGLRRLAKADWWPQLRRFQAVPNLATVSLLAKMLAKHPAIHTIDLRNAEEATLLAFHAAGSFKSLRALRLQVSATSADIAAFAKSKLPALVDLELYSRLKADDVSVLRRAKWFGDLRRLLLSAHSMGEKGVKTLIEAIAGSRLRWLTLQDGELGKSSLQAFATDGLLPALTVLELPPVKDTVSVADINRFIGGLTSPVRQLVFRAKQADASTIDALAGNPAIGQLTYLHFEGAVDAKRLRKLAEAPQLQELVYLNLPGVTHDALKVLEDTDAFPNLGKFLLPNRTAEKLSKKLESIRGPIFFGGL